MSKERIAEQKEMIEGIKEQLREEEQKLQDMIYAHRYKSGVNPGFLFTTIASATLVYYLVSTYVVP